MGDIREPLGEARRTFLEGLFTGNDRETEDLYWRENLEAAERLRALGPGDAVRIWADQTPHSACGLLHAASLLKGANAAVSVVTLPPWRALSDNAVETYLGWGEVAPELFGHFLSREEPLPPAVLGVLTGRWRELQEENAPLRAVINGPLVSTHPTQILVLPASSARIMSFLPFKKLYSLTIISKMVFEFKLCSYR